MSVLFSANFLFFIFWEKLDILYVCRFGECMFARALAEACIFKALELCRLTQALIAQLDSAMDF